MQIPSNYLLLKSGLICNQTFGSKNIVLLREYKSIQVHNKETIQTKTYPLCFPCGSMSLVPNGRQWLTENRNQENQVKRNIGAVICACCILNCQLLVLRERHVLEVGVLAQSEHE
ncbi:hypothetical protein Pfo_023836 [Paulownia fortunei]|nr:hypothetical protein Pfo_023836 [Paulownia fortunei]